MSSGELVSLTTRFTDELMAEGLTKRILMLVSDINVNKEFGRLQKERGLGNEKHRKEVRDRQTDGQTDTHSQSTPVCTYTSDVSHYFLIQEVH